MLQSCTVGAFKTFDQKTAGRLLPCSLHHAWRMHIKLIHNCYDTDSQVLCRL